jgi:hypothetical protein
VPASRQEPVAHRHRLVQQTSRVVAQIQDQAGQLPPSVLRPQPIQLLLERGVRSFLEILESHPPDGPVERTLHRDNAHVIAQEHDVLRLGEARSHQGERHPLAGRTPHLGAGPSHVHALGALPVDGQDLIPGLDPGSGGRGVVHRRDHHQHLPPLHHVQTQAAELARGVDLHLLEDLGRHEHGVGVERVQHSADCAIYQLSFVHPFDVIVLYVRKHTGEQLELFVRPVLGIRCRGGGGSGGEEEGAGERGDAGHGGQRNRSTIQGSSPGHPPSGWTDNTNSYYPYPA